MIPDYVRRVFARYLRYEYAEHNDFIVMERHCSGLIDRSVPRSNNDTLWFHHVQSRLAQWISEQPIDTNDLVPSHLPASPSDPECNGDS